jgi:hypothetical protein
MFLMMSPTGRSATSAPLVTGEPTDLRLDVSPHKATNVGLFDRFGSYSSPCAQNAEVVVN